MTKYAIAVAVWLVAQPALAQDAPPAARYSMTPIEGGALRLDTLTGAVDRCVAEAGVWSCRALPDEGRALQDEIDRLAEENAELRGRLSAAGADAAPPAAGGLSDGPVMSFKLPSEEEVDRAMSFMERVLKRFKSMVDGLSEDEGRDTAL